MGPRIREDKGSVSRKGSEILHSASLRFRMTCGGVELWTEWHVWEGEKMGPRIREDKGRGSLEGNEILHSASLRSE